MKLVILAPYSVKETKESLLNKSTFFILFLFSNLAAPEPAPQDDANNAPSSSDSSPSSSSSSPSSPSSYNSYGNDGGIYGQYSNIYGNVPLTRPAWPLPRPVMPQQQGPFYSGYQPGAMGGWTTLPASLNTNQQPDARTFSSYPAAAPAIQRSYQYPRSYQQPSNQLYQQTSPGAAQVTNWNPQPQEQEEEDTAEAQTAAFTSGVEAVDVNEAPVASWRSGAAQQTSWSAPAQQTSWGMQQNWAPQPMQQQTWGNSYYMAPQQQSWQTVPQQQPQQWTTTQNQFQQPTIQWQQPAQQQQQPVRPQPTIQLQQPQVTQMSGVSTTQSFAPGQAQWRKSYTPIAGKGGCFNRCRPSCGSQYAQYGCSPSCRSSCNIRPTCGRRTQPQWAGNTMVCGSNRPNYGASWGMDNSYYGSNNNNYGYGGNTQQYSRMQAEPQARAAPAAAPAPAASDASEGDDDAEDAAN